MSLPKQPGKAAIGLGSEVESSGDTFFTTSGGSPPPIYPNLDMNDAERAELRYEWERLPDMCPRCGGIVGPCRVDIETSTAYYGCPYHSGPELDGKFRWGPVSWPTVKLWRARNIKVVERFVDPEPMARTTDGRPIYEKPALSHTAASVKERPLRPGEARYGPPERDINVPSMPPGVYTVGGKTRPRR